MRDEDLRTQVARSSKVRVRVSHQFAPPPLRENSLSLLKEKVLLLGEKMFSWGDEYSLEQSNLWTSIRWKRRKLSSGGGGEGGGGEGRRRMGRRRRFTQNAKYFLECLERVYTQIYTSADSEGAFSLNELLSVSTSGGGRRRNSRLNKPSIFYWQSTCIQ